MRENKPEGNPFRLLATQAPNVDLRCKVSKPSHDHRLDFKHNILRIEDPQDDEERRIFIVEFNITVSNTDKTLTLTVKYHVIFKCENEVTEEYLTTPLIQINATAIAFPFLRSFVTTITANAGFPPIFLPSINFVKLLKQPSEEP